MIFPPFDPAAVLMLAAISRLAPQEPAVAAANALAQRPAQIDPTEIRLTPAEAESLFLPGMAVHVMFGRRGDRWTKGHAIAALRAARSIRLTSPATWSTGFGLVVDRDSGESVLMTAEIPKVRVWLERQVAEAAE